LATGNVFGIQVVYLGRTTGRKETIEGRRSGWEDNIKIDVK
jgi:hypothetical protein